MAYEVDGERLTYNVRPANLTGVSPDAEARQHLRDKGLPQSEAYVQWQIRTLAGLRGAQNPRPATEQVRPRSMRKKGGAAVTGLTEKDVVTEFDELGRPTEKLATLKDSTWQLDILDYSRQDAPTATLW